MESERTVRRPSVSGQAAFGLPPDEETSGTVIYDENGVDLSLIRESLERTPAERLDLADGYAQEIEVLRMLVREA